MLKLMGTSNGDVITVTLMGKGKGDVACLLYSLDADFCILKYGLLKRSRIVNEEYEFRSELVECDGWLRTK